MGEAGVFAPDARLELIEGEIIDMAPIGTWHAGMVARLNRWFVERSRGKAVVSPQNPVIASKRSVPQPDILLLRARADDYMKAHPTPADVLLVVEVADSTLPFDLRTKVPLYARSGVPEAWVVDVNGRAVHVYRDASEGAYRTSVVAANADRIECAALPEVWIRVKELFA
jgi:Uma2 family endonuclease